MAQQWSHSSEAAQMPATQACICAACSSSLGCSTRFRMQCTNCEQGRGHQLHAPGVQRRWPPAGSAQGYGLGVICAGTTGAARLSASGSRQSPWRCWRLRKASTPYPGMLTSCRSPPGRQSHAAGSGWGTARVLDSQKAKRQREAKKQIDRDNPLLQALRCIRHVKSAFGSATRLLAGHYNLQCSMHVEGMDPVQGRMLKDPAGTRHNRKWISPNNPAMKNSHSSTIHT